GQFSDDVSEALNGLQAAGRLSIHFHGPSQRIVAEIPQRIQSRVRGFFRDYFGPWRTALDHAFAKWAYLNNDQILVKAHDDPTYKQSQHGQIIAKSGLLRAVDFEGMDEDVAETLTDFVDPRLTGAL